MKEEGKTRLRCRPGDLAIVTKCGVPERIGLLVRVLEPCRTNGYDWITELLGPGVVARDVSSGELKWCSRALMHDWNLTPINGPDPRRQRCRPEDVPVRQKA